MDAQHKRYRQVAIVVSSLDRDTADQVLEQMSEEEASAVRRAILSLDEISAEEQTLALNEFLRRSGKSMEVSTSRFTSRRGALDSGVQLDIDFAVETGAEVRQTIAALGVETPSVARPAFACLQGVDGAWLAQRLGLEHPQTIAVVVSHLSQTEAARLLGALPPDRQADVIRRLADLDEMDLESLREIESCLSTTLAESLRDRQRRKAGVSNVAAILHAADPQTRHQLVKQLRLSDQQLADQLRQTSAPPATGTSSLPSATAVGAPSGEVPLNVDAENVAKNAPWSGSRQGDAPTPALAFEELAHWTERSLRLLLRECEPDVILLALTGASERLVQRVLEMFPARQAATLRHALHHPGPTRLSDVTGAQDTIARTAWRLEQEGRLPKRSGRLSMAA